MTTKVGILSKALYGKANSKVICPACHVLGVVQQRKFTDKTRHGRRVQRTQSRCSNCKSEWVL